VKSPNQKQLWSSATTKKKIASKKSPPISRQHFTTEAPNKTAHLPKLSHSMNIDESIDH
jgi:hypothetical protein